MKLLRLTGGLLLCVSMLGSVASAQTSSRRRVDPPAQVSDPTVPLTIEQQQAAEERLRWEREFDRDY